MGEIIWATHHVPTVDLFSYTAMHHRWIPHEWLSQLTIYAAYRSGDYAGLMAWLCILSAVQLVAGYVLCSVVAGNSKVTFLGVLEIWLFATVGFAVRPQMIGYVLLIVELLLLHLGRTRDVRCFWALPPLFALWVNCHGSFMVGVAIAVITYAVSFIGLQAGALISARWDPIRRRHLGWSLALSVATLFLNPVGKGQILYPLDTMLHQSIGLSQVQEWQPLQVTEPRAIPFLLLLLCIFLLVLVRRRESQSPHPLSIALGPVGKLRSRARSSFAECGFYLSLSSRRSVGIPRPAGSGYSGRTDQPCKGRHLLEDPPCLRTNAQRLYIWRVSHLGRTGVSSLRRRSFRCF
jgi:hypothetical protein